MMEKILGSEQNNRHEIHRILVAGDGHYCCYIAIDGGAPRNDDDWSWISIGSISDYPCPDYNLTIRGRLKVAWNGLRGRLWGYQIELNTRSDYDRFMDAMEEMGEKVFPVETK